MAKKLVAAFLVAACVGSILLSLLVMANRSVARIVQDRKETDHVAISVDDVPANWVAIDLNRSQLESLWSLLPDLLTVNSEATWLLSGCESADGIVGASTILIQTESPAALPNDVTGVYVTVTNLARPGSLRSRQVHRFSHGHLYFDSLVFSSERILAIVGGWDREQQVPAIDLVSLERLVEERLGVYEQQLPFGRVTKEMAAEFGALQGSLFTLTCRPLL